MDSERFITYEKHLHDLCFVSKAITMNELKLLQFIGSRWSSVHGNWCILSGSQLADQIGVSRVMIQRMLKHLFEMGILELGQTSTQTIARRISADFIRVGGVPTIDPVVTQVTRSFISYSSNNLIKKNHPENSGPKIEASRSIQIKEPYVPFFPEIKTKTEKNPPSELHLQWARTLHDALSTDVTMPPRKGAWKKWAKDFQLLEQKDEVKVHRIEKVLKWLCSSEQIKGTRCRSGRMFRDMFEQLESFAGWSKSIDASDGIQLSKIELLHLKHLDNFSQAMASNTLKEAATILKQNLHRLVDAIQLEPDRLGSPAKREAALRRIAKLKSSEEWYTILEAMCYRLKRWNEWSGDLRPAARNILKPKSIELNTHFKSLDLQWTALLESYKDLLSDC